MEPPESVQAMIDQLSSETPLMEMEATCQPLNFKGNEGVVSLTRWIEKMESVFNTSGCAIENQVKFAIYTLLGLLTGGMVQINSPMVLTHYQRLGKCTEENDQTSNNRRAIELANDFIDPEHSAPSVKSTDTKERLMISPETTMVTKNTLQEQKCRQVGHFARDYRGSGNTNVANTQKGNGANPKGNGCFECEALGHFKKDCPKLKNKNEGSVNAQGYAEKKGNASRDPDSNVVTENSQYDGRDQLMGKSSRDKKEHEEHLKAILELLKKEKLYAKFSKCDFWIPNVHQFCFTLRGSEDFVVYCDASHKGLGVVLMQREKAAPYEALYGRKCRSPVCWAEVGEAQLTGPELIQETTEKSSLNKQRFKLLMNRQKEVNADLKRKPMEFSKCLGIELCSRSSPVKGLYDS
ncbi:putative reverse transcriptase domain-containing protein [Tanacetum coccineum]|uniref:Reverse transcriptase domain-containing protein n=1 Tax=Tanacetum coccineum TaxID=301880 RepID=A0ABQ5CFH9_9ASTR